MLNINLVPHPAQPSLCSLGAASECAVLPRKRASNLVHLI
jgi:hypothetical protein